ncbi:MAG: hypothetical protein ACYC63_00445 [Armatimonadota bacterium]
MALKVGDVVGFRAEKLFNGAVNVGWLESDPARALAAAQGFVFHGPAYHGVTQDDVGNHHGYKLVDTASFTLSVARRCCGLEKQPFSLAIAGYGTGKSHLALTLASLLSDPSSSSAGTIVDAIAASDAAIGSELRAVLREHPQPALVVVLNGMGNFDLAAEVSRQIMRQAQARGLSTEALEQLRPRFTTAARLISTRSEEHLEGLLQACGLKSADAVLAALERQDEQVYEHVHSFCLSEWQLDIRSLGGESVADVLEAASEVYCGPEKPFGRLIILFDEFGRYMEFATERRQIAGSGVLQQLYEGIQGCADLACLVGFVQFELNAYVQRVPPELRNDIRRYVTRYQSAARSYLSVNLETLIANLLEKRQPQRLDQWFDTPRERSTSAETLRQLGRWYPTATQHRLWTDPDQFHQVIRTGCWPLSPYATWFLYYLTAAGRHLQERSALSLLDQALQRYRDLPLAEQPPYTVLAPVDLWSEELQQELIASEESGQQGAVAGAYASAEATHGAHVSDQQRAALRAVVIAAKLGLRVANRAEALEALAALTRTPASELAAAVRHLEREANVLQWDESLKAFAILGDTVPRAQFLGFLRQSVSSSFDDLAKSRLFARQATDCCEALGGLEADFAEESRIVSSDWRFTPHTANTESLEPQVRLAVDRCPKSLAVGEPRGAVIYCYLQPDEDPEAVSEKTAQLLRSRGNETGFPVPPVLVVLLWDAEGEAGRALSEMAVLDRLGDADRASYGGLVDAQRARAVEILNEQVEAMIRQRRYVTAMRAELQATRLRAVATELFRASYRTPLPFPFDGYGTAHGNAAETCQELIADLLQGRLVWDDVQAKPPRVRNRAVAVLEGAWDIFKTDGTISLTPRQTAVRSIFDRWQKVLRDGAESFRVGQQLRSICLPPYGANSASSALLFAVFAAARLDELALLREQEVHSLSLLARDGLFQGRSINLAALDEYELIRTGEASSEWEQLLDEWDHETAYSGRVRCREKAAELERRVPVPPALRFRYAPLCEQAGTAARALEEKKKVWERAMRHLAPLNRNADVEDMARGTSFLQEFVERTEQEPLQWPPEELADFTSQIDRQRQRIIQGFSDWLAQQKIATVEPDDVATFKHRLQEVVAPALARLQLQVQSAALEQHVTKLIAEVAVRGDVQRLCAEVRDWMLANADARLLPRVARLRALIEVGKAFGTKLQGLSRRCSTVELNDQRQHLAAHLAGLREAETSLVKQKQALARQSIRNHTDLKTLLETADKLSENFDGCLAELEELRALRERLQVYRRLYRELANAELTWLEFERIVERRQGELSSLGPEPPWPPDKIIPILVEQAGARRKRDSTAWIEGLENDLTRLAEMNGEEANRLRVRAEQPPAVLTEAHRGRLVQCLGRIEESLGSMELEALLARFRALSPSMRETFLRLAANLSEEE